MKKKAVIIGAGPAGLTAAYELTKYGIYPVIFEEASDIGGLSKTINYKGNRMDIGGHRFFSKSDEVMNWWLNILPLENSDFLASNNDNVMLSCSRLSRIYFLKKFFDYPISLSLKLFFNLGLIRTLKIGFSYIKSSISPKQEENLEDFFINRFGEELYLTFFKDYTEKVWGKPCHEIKPEWGKQRIKGLSLKKTIKNSIQTLFSKNNCLTQKNKETSLINKFMYPKMGSGFLWETVANVITSQNGEINLNQKIIQLKHDQKKITSFITKNQITGKETEHISDYFISSMPIKDLIKSLGSSVPENIQQIASGLQYRDFIIVGVLISKFKSTDKQIKDNWIYIQEKYVKLGRFQIFNNWSPYLVKDPDNILLGLEYFCKEGDEVWNMADENLCKFAIKELEQLGFIQENDVIDSVVYRIPKAYPAYFGTYNEFNKVKDYLNNFENLYLIGRNGMHKYNNMDHSMLSAIEAVKNIINSRQTKDNIWNINAEETYNEAS